MSDIRTNYKIIAGYPQSNYLGVSLLPPSSTEVDLLTITGNSSITKAFFTGSFNLNCWYNIKTNLLTHMCDTTDTVYVF